ncbi:MAG TPA: IclR family transcriptional regulator [Amaricoccus sp.]|uniref:IclR family transcriptional regulator n=1 Tax=Amaricoccus sp. TaxID=1872485 RepID=UPI001D8BA03B|nr:IclR family transcriptional regulator [Amaricoccus sp.]MCB1372674.1 IclR family transcriptional regulator [Paracoccaceae bacterium]MCC0065825.1 IclR family transcriptional regulator [Rhodovulum sp.]MCB1401485.1 IclR family transcriptional regulator [Paracoccaceae bacterium]HPG21685.1 IclR family transcriptional regulator [Amaricoccus sp.]HRW14428.1 IclR family transcriptional regulator [Amaricoccus sp.]
MTVLQNASDVLRLFGSGCSDLTVTEVTTRLGIPKANASRLLKAMRDAGMLETIGDTRRHRPGRMMLDLASAFRKSLGVIGQAGEVVAAVTERFGHTGYVSLREGREVTAVADFPGTNDLRVVSNIGRRLTAHGSATGRTLLARMSDAEVEAVYAGRPELDGLLPRLDAIRACGFAYSSQESTPGVDAIAIAVGDPATEEAVSLCIVYPHAVVGEDGRDEMLAALASGATRIARDLGDAKFVAPRIPEKGLFA